jgi:hypothetical protein
MKHPLETPDRRKTAQGEIDAAIKEMEVPVRQRLQKLDKLHTERLCERYSHLVPAERIQKVKDLPTVFENRMNFERSRREAGVAKPNDGNEVVAFYPGNFESAHVNMDNPQAEKNAIHERVHELSDPRAVAILGERFNEGTTENLAIKELGHEPSPELPPSYPQERAAAQELQRMCGDNTVDRAIFAGDSRQLWASLDRSLGKENLDKLGRMTDAPAPDEQDQDDAGQ